MNLVDNYILLRDKTFGYIDSNTGFNIIGEYSNIQKLLFIDQVLPAF